MAGQAHRNIFLIYHTDMKGIKSLAIGRSECAQQRQQVFPSNAIHHPYQRLALFGVVYQPHSDTDLEPVDQLEAVEAGASMKKKEADREGDGSGKAAGKYFTGGLHRWRKS